MSRTRVSARVPFEIAVGRIAACVIVWTPFFLAGIGVGAGLSGPAAANGFSLPVQDTLQVGRANAGTVAAA